MRCPKCSYLSYEEVERCRNCGYDFALAVPPAAAEAPTLDLPGEPRSWQGYQSRTPRSPTDLLPAEEEGTAVDLPLFEAPVAPVEPPPVATPEPPREPRRQVRPETEAPPLPIPPVAPPLVVRRTVDVARTPRAREVSVPALDFDDPAPPEPVPVDDRQAPVEDAGWVTGPAPDVDDGQASSIATARVTAGLVDVGVLLAIDLLVVWLTLRLLGLEFADWGRLPLAPLCGFLFLLDTSYFVTFTAASGQTLGKMSAGLRVLAADGGRVPFGHAVVRAVVLLLCVIPAGIGLLPVLFDARGRGLHDRVAGTRVARSR